MVWKKSKLKDILKQYKIYLYVRDDITYRQVTVSQTGKVLVRGEKQGIKIGRKRQFLIDLKKHPRTLIFIRQGVEKGGIGICPPEVDGCIVTENMPMFDIVNIDPDFLFMYLKSKSFKKELDKIVPTGTAQKAVHEKNLLELEVPVPSIEDQKKLVKNMKELQHDIIEIENKLREDLDKAKLLKKAILNEAFEKENDPQ